MGESAPGPTGLTWALEQDMLRPRGHRPSGREHERAPFNLECPLGANQELVFGRYPLRRGWTLVREIRRWNGVGSDRKHDKAKQVSGETRSDPGWYLQGRKRRITREVAEWKRSSRRGSAGSLLKGTKRGKPKLGPTGSTWAKDQSHLRHAPPGPSG